MPKPVVFSAAVANESGIVKKRPPPHIKKRRQSRRVINLPKKASGLFSKGFNMADKINHTAASGRGIKNHNKKGHWENPD
jgi:hypothetical protein